MNAWPARTFLMLTTAVRGTPEGIAAARTDDRHRRSLQTWLAVYRGRRPGHGRRFGALAAVPAVLGKRARKALILNPTGRPSRMKCSTFAASWHHFRPAHGMNPIDGPDKPSPPASGCRSSSSPVLRQPGFRSGLWTGPSGGLVPGDEAGAGTSADSRGGLHVWPEVGRYGQSHHETGISVVSGCDGQAPCSGRQGGTKCLEVSGSNRC
jgi:hypothetical protein